MKQFVKRILYTVAPGWTTGMMSARARAHSHRVVEEWGGALVANKLIERVGTRVQDGPFAGLTLTPMTWREQIGPYLLGTYESELDHAWEVVFSGAYSQIIDIGAKFGYYAVGLAKRYPEARVLAFDTDWWARKAVKEMVTANATPNVEVRGLCTADWLKKNVQKSSLIIVDCEGCEAAMFPPDVVEVLQSSTLVIETHDVFVPGVSDRLQAAFTATHSVRIFGGEARRSSNVPLEFLSEKERLLATQEVRPQQVWLLCLPKRGPNAALASRASE